MRDPPPSERNQPHAVATSEGVNVLTDSQIYERERQTRRVSSGRRRERRNRKCGRNSTKFSPPDIHHYSRQLTASIPPYRSARLHAFLHSLPGYVSPTDSSSVIRHANSSRTERHPPDDIVSSATPGTHRSERERFLIRECVV